MEVESEKADSAYVWRSWLRFWPEAFGHVDRVCRLWLRQVIWWWESKGPPCPAAGAEEADAGVLSSEMDMFQSILETIPKTRSQMVNELDIPEDLTVAPYNWSEPEESLDCDSIPSVSIDEFEVRTVGSDSSLSLSRAMTDSEIDYDRYRKLRNRSSSDPWAPIRIAIDAFPTDYINSLNSFQGTQSVSPEALNFERHKHNEELKQKMERFFEDECRVFSPDDPGLKILEEALQNVDFESSDLESDLS